MDVGIEEVIGTLKKLKMGRKQDWNDIHRFLVVRVCVFVCL